jgi:hypothetical protein
MKKIFFLIIVLLPLIVHSQSDSLDKGFSFNMQIGYLIPTQSVRPWGIQDGFAFKPSIQFKTSEITGWFTELSYSRLKNDSRFGNSHYLNYLLINAGLKIHPNRKNFYFKTGLGFAWVPEDQGYGYSLNAGAGNEFKINKKIDFVIEGEISHHKVLFFSYWDSIFDFIISTGIRYKF